MQFLLQLPASNTRLESKTFPLPPFFQLFSSTFHVETTARIRTFTVDCSKLISHDLRQAGAWTNRSSLLPPPFLLSKMRSRRVWEERHGTLDLSSLPLWWTSSSWGRSRRRSAATGELRNSTLSLSFFSPNLTSLPLPFFLFRRSFNDKFKILVSALFLINL